MDRERTFTFFSLWCVCRVVNQFKCFAWKYPKSHYTFQLTGHTSVNEIFADNNNQQQKPNHEMQLWNRNAASHLTMCDRSPLQMQISSWIINYAPKWNIRRTHQLFVMFCSVLNRPLDHSISCGDVHNFCFCFEELFKKSHHSELIPIDIIAGFHWMVFFSHKSELLRRLSDKWK